jgi:hypothetical protein
MDFRQAQWDYRGCRDESLAAFIETQKEKWAQHGYSERVRDADFGDKISKEWRPASTRCQDFSGWTKEVKRCCDLWGLDYNPELKQDPRTQSAAGDWQEYLAFEHNHLEDLRDKVTDSAKRVKTQIHLSHGELKSRAASSSKSDFMLRTRTALEELIERSSYNASVQQEWSRQFCFVEWIAQQAHEESFQSRDRRMSARDLATVACKTRPAAATRSSRKRRRGDLNEADTFAPPDKKARIKAASSIIEPRRSTRLRNMKNTSQNHELYPVQI